VGWKVYGNTVAGSPHNTAGRLSNTSVISADVYAREYNGRDTILNRVYNKNGTYEAAPARWDFSALEIAFSADADGSKNNE
jgi:hypothetical protein